MSWHRNGRYDPTQEKVLWAVDASTRVVISIKQYGSEGVPKIAISTRDSRGNLHPVGWLTAEDAKAVHDHLPEAIEELIRINTKAMDKAVAPPGSSEKPKQKEDRKEDKEEKEEQPKSARKQRILGGLSGVGL